MLLMLQTLKQEIEIGQDVLSFSSTFKVKIIERQPEYIYNYNICKAICNKDFINVLGIT